MLFKKEILVELLWNDIGVEDDDDGFTLVETNVIGERRWVFENEMIFMHQNKYYVTYYETAKHEDGDCRPYEYEDDEIECEEVFPVEVKKIVYKTAKALHG